MKEQEAVGIGFKVWLSEVSSLQISALIWTLSVILHVEIAPQK